MAIVTANIASYFIERGQQSDSEILMEKMSQIERHLHKLEEAMTRKSVEVAAALDRHSNRPEGLRSGGESERGVHVL